MTETITGLFQQSKMMKIFPLLILLGLVSNLSATTRIVFSVHQDTERSKGEEKISESKEYELSIYLGDTFIEYSNGNSRRIIDFKENKIFHSSTLNSGFIETSIYSDIGFRVYEFQNRMMLGGALNAAGINNNPMDRVLMEHLFSIRSGEKADLKIKKEGEHIFYSHGDKALISYSTEGSSVNEAEMNRFILFMRYRYGIHPDILVDLQKEGEIPNILDVGRFNTASFEKFELKLKSFDHTDYRYAITQEERSKEADDALIQIHAKASGIDNDAYRKRCMSLLPDAIQLAKEEKYLDSMLLFFEYTLAAGEQLPKEFYEFKSALASDKDVALLFASISPQSKAAAEKAVDDLLRLANKSNEAKEVAWIFRANILTSLRKTDEAKELFLKALSKNPLIVGAWKDLGDIYYSQYESAQAWLCWDTGRSINPKHHLFTSIYGFEKKLRDDHPEFFMQ